MFSSGPRTQSQAEYHRERAGKAVTAASLYASRADDWFDGSVDSVDSRLAMCDKLLHQARAALGMGGIGNATALDRVASLETDRKGLTSLREDLTNGMAYREASNATALARQASVLVASLHPDDRRYVELEASKILRANASCRDFEELGERARRIAAEDTSSFSPRRSAEVTEALAARTIQLARRTRPQTRTAAAPRAVEDFPSELMYF